MRLQRDSYAPKKCAFDAANVQFLRAHLCKSHPVLQQERQRSRMLTLCRSKTTAFSDFERPLRYCREKPVIPLRRTVFCLSEAAG